MNKRLVEVKYEIGRIEILREAFLKMFRDVSPSLVLIPVVISNRKHRNLNLG